MLGTRRSPETRVKYLVEGESEPYETFERAAPDGNVVGIEITYCCPYCDAPNKFATAVPVPSSRVHDCEYCDNRVELFDAANCQLDSSEVEANLEPLDEYREQRRAGERLSRSRYLRWRVEKEAIALGVALGLVLLVVFARPAVLSAISSFNLAGLAAAMFGVAGILAAKYVLLNTLIRWRSPDGISEGSKETEFVKHGQKIRKGEEVRYIPPEETVRDEEEYSLSKEQPDGSASSHG